MSVITTLEGQNNLPRYFKGIFNTLQSIRFGSIKMHLNDGRVFFIEGHEPGKTAEIIFCDNDCLNRLMRDGELGFLEAYMDKQWTTPDLQDFMDFMFANITTIDKNFRSHVVAGKIVQIFEKISYWLKSNSRNQARKNISYHYDLGNDFYAKWLDETMTYSSAFFKTGKETLKQAQIQKYEKLCDSLEVKENDHLLEIGCGWGGFAEYAATIRGAKVKALTISRQQYLYAKERMARLGLDDKVDVVMQDYRDEQGTYDGIASIEMFEAVGEKYWPVYFDRLNSCLKEGAKATLQIITVPPERFDTYRSSVDFIQKYIFPGGMLPTETILKSEIARTGMTFKNLAEFRKSYSITLRRWFENFNEKWDEISDLNFDDRFYRMWSLYLTSCAAGFEYRATELIQVTIQK